MHNVEKWSNILYTFCGVHTARFLKYVWPFFNIMHEKIIVIIFLTVGHRNVAELLLNRFAYRDCRTKTGITPLFQACRENHIAIVELLLEHGAGVNAPFPNSRENPLTLCAEKGHKVLVEMLLEKGASHDCRTKKGCTPVYLASKEGHLDIVKILANIGANMETSDARGNTPIMAAYKNGHVPVRFKIQVSLVDLFYYFFNYLSVGIIFKMILFKKE